MYQFTDILDSKKLARLKKYFNCYIKVIRMSVKIIVTNIKYTYTELVLIFLGVAIGFG